VRFVALALWSGTACAGLYLLAGWLAHGGIRRQPTKVTRYPVTMFFSHPVLALTGLGLWIRYLAGGGITYAWAAFGVLCGSALLGFALLTRWLTGIGGRHARTEAEHFPAWAVALHGLAGLATFILVLITATIMSQISDLSPRRYRGPVLSATYLGTDR
jgi:hypothetical protein